MRRRLLLSFLFASVVLVALIALLPFWGGKALAFAGRSRGLTFVGYERIGYTRFALVGVDYRRAPVRVTVSRVEADTPALWLWRHWRHSPSLVIGGDWTVTVETPSASKPPTVDRGWVLLQGQLQRIAAKLEQWLPQAATRSGVVRWPGGDVAVNSAIWSGRRLETKGLVFRGFAADATADFATAGEIKVTARRLDGAARADLISAGPKISGHVYLWEQLANLEGTYGSVGWLPSAASLQAVGWTIPGEKLRVEGLYPVVKGAARVEWRADRFSAEIYANGEPRPGTVATPLALEVRGEGDWQTYTVAALHATLPGITAHLSAPVTFDRTGQLRESSAQFSVEADLSQLPWMTAAGQVHGTAQVVAAAGRAPGVEFALEAKAVRAQAVSLSSIAARGRLDWPRLQVAEGAIVGGAGERLTWNGGYDFQKKEIIDAAVAGEVRRESLARWLPSKPDFDAVTITLAARGPMAEVSHRGRLQAENVRFVGVKPLQIDLTWQAHAAVLDEFHADVQAGETMIRASGTGNTSSITFSGLELSHGAERRLQSAGQSTLRWRPQLQLETLRLSGPDGRIELDGTAGERGHVVLDARQLPSSWLADFTSIPGPAWTIHRLALRGEWDRGPMTFQLSSEAGVALGEGREAVVALVANGTRTGVLIEKLSVTEGSETVVQGAGRFPLILSPGVGPFIQLDADGPLVLDANVEPNAAFWRNLASASGLELTEPKATASLKGTWQRPEGRASLLATRIAIDPKRSARPWPAIDALDVELVGDKTGVTLSRFALKVEGQVVRAAGHLPVPDGRWSELVQQPLAAARTGGDMRIEIPDAEVAAFARFLPAVLAPKGRLQADLHYALGGVEGFVRIQDAASRPLGPLGVLQEVSADVGLAGRKLTLRSVTAKSGGQPVTLTGTVELPEAGEPRFDLTLKGENLPFVRQTGLLLRGDLDLKLKTADGPLPRLSGTVRLRESLFLTDVRSFLPKGGASARRRPPYFSIETMPLATWLLAVDVTGEKFLRLRTPVFVGVASARFRLGGTLGEPRAIGEITIDEGSVRMPFASFSVTQGSVRLTEADPFEPAIYVRATGRRYNYDLAMEIKGSATKPEVVFSSSPALESEQLLLMVMTGSAPSNEINRSAAQRVANVGLFLGQSLLASLGSDTADIDRLSFSSGEKISRQGKETYEIGYKLSDRWSVTGEYNEFDEYNAGLKWRLFRGQAAPGDAANAKK